MKKLNVFLVSVLATAALNATETNPAVIEQVIVRQQWPWSTDVKIEYKLKDVSSPVDVSVEAYNGDEKLDQSRLNESLTGDRFGVTDVVGTIILDPVKAFGTEKVALANFKVKLSLSGSSENINEVIYKIVDLGDGSVVDVKRSDILGGKYGSFETDFGRIGSGYETPLKDVLIWTGVTNNPVYKTDKLVLRKIPAAGKTFAMGSNNTTDPGRNTNEDQHDVTLQHDFWIGVFELTQGQACKIYGSEEVLEKMGKETVSFAKGPNRMWCPLFAHYLGLRGNQDVQSQYVLWPGNGHEVGIKYSSWGLAYPTVLSQLRLRAPTLAFDLATEAQWEFACRGGTTSGIYTGETMPGNVSSGVKYGPADVLGRYKFNGGYGNDESATTEPDDTTETLGPAVVGSYRPNAYGLYDMYGNAEEWVLDGYVANLGTEAVTEPVGLASADQNSSRTTKGSSWAGMAKCFRSAYRSNANGKGAGSNAAGKYTGCRVCVTE